MENMKNKLLLVFSATQCSNGWARREIFTITFPGGWLENSTKRRVECHGSLSANWVFQHSSQRIRSTHRPLLRSDLWWTLSKRGRGRDRGRENLVSLPRSLLKSANITFPFFPEFWLKSWLANTSRDGFKFRQLLGKGCQARFSQHDLLHQGMEQGEVLVFAAELGELRGGDKGDVVRRVVTHVTLNTHRK